MYSPPTTMASDALVSNVFDIAALAVAAFALLAVSAAACAAARQVLIGRRTRKWLTTLVVASGIGGAIAGAAIPAMPALFGPAASTLLTGSPAAAVLRWIAITLVYAVMLMLATGVFERLLSHGPGDAGRFLARTLIPAVGCTAVAFVLAGFAGRFDTTLTLAPDALRNSLPTAAMMAAVVALNCAALARGAASESRTRWIIFTAAALPSVLGLLITAGALIAARRTLGEAQIQWVPPDDSVEPVLAAGPLIMRWVWLYPGMLVVGSLGGWMGIRMTAARPEPLPPLFAPARRTGSPPTDDEAVSTSAVTAADTPTANVRFPTSLQFAAAALLLSLLAFYASLIPLDFDASKGTFEQGIERFRNIHWLELGIERRADWVANIVLFVPLGFLWMGALDRRGRPWITSLFFAPIVFAGLVFWLCAIEFAQFWFPPRTISQNDMYAEAIGSLIGIGVWLAFGRAIAQAANAALSTAGTATARRVILIAYAIALTLYALMPFDVVTTMAQLREKAAAGRMALMPFSMSYGSAFDNVLHVAQQVVMTTPLGMLAALGWDWRGKPRTTGSAVMWVAAYAAIIFVAQAPIYTAANDVGDVILMIIGGAAGVWLVKHVLGPDGAVALDERLSRPMQKQIALALSATCIAAAAILLWHPWQFQFRAEDGTLFTQGFSTFINWPFQAYYYGSEWDALQKLLMITLLFAPVGALVCWAWRSKRAVLIAMVAVFAAGVMIESGQAFIPWEIHFYSAQDIDAGRPGLGAQAIETTPDWMPQGQEFATGPMADITDVLAYTSGVLVGAIAAALFLPRVTRRDGGATGARE